MDRIDTYRQIVCQFLEEFATDDPEAYLVFDRQSDRYLVIHNGWRGESRIYGIATTTAYLLNKLFRCCQLADIPHSIHRSIAPSMGSKTIVFTCASFKLFRNDSSCKNRR
jgi:hypothetical protein